MASRLSMKRRKFKRQDYHRFRKLKNGWRKATGRQSKQRKGKVGNCPNPKVGFGNDKKRRGFVQGKKVLFVSNMNDLNVEKNEKLGVMISGKIGLKKFEDIYKKAQEIGFTILNPKRIKKVSKRAKLVERKKNEKPAAKKAEKRIEKKAETKQLSEDVKTVEKKSD